MKTAISAGLLALSLTAVNAAPRKGLKEVKGETWNSITLEGAAFLGELKYQAGDYSEAGRTFKDSLNSSVHMRAPDSPVMGLDLYRLAQLAASQGRRDQARHHLEILIHRYPDSDFAEKARSLLAFLDGEETGGPLGAPVAELADSSLTAEAGLGRIQSLVKSGAWREARGETRDFLSRHPGHRLVPEARLLEAIVLLELQPARAIAPLSELARQGPPHLRSRAAYLWAGAAFAAKDCGQVRQAVPAIDPAKSGDRWLGLAQVWRAACAGLHGRGPEASTLFAKSAAAAPESPLTAYSWAALAVDADRRGDPKAAQSLLERSRALSRRWRIHALSRDLEWARGQVLLRLRRFDAAAAAFGSFAAAGDHPRRTHAWLQKGLALRRAGRSREAAKTFEELLAKAPDSALVAEAHLQLAQIASETGDSGGAVVHYQRMGEGGVAAQREALLLEAQEHYNNKRYRQAIPLYWKHLERFPNDARRKEVGNLLMTSYWQGDRRSPDLAKAAELFPDHPVVAHMRWEIAVSAYQAGDCAAAADSFSKFAAQHPGSPKVSEGLWLRAECLRKGKDFASAERAYADFLERNPDSPRARDAKFSRALALHEGGRLEEAAQIYLQIGGKDRLAQDAAYNAALARVKGARPAAALAALENLLERFPLHSQAPWAWLKTGQLREDFKRWGPAATAYARAEATAQSIIGLGRCQEGLRRLPAARRTYERLLTISPLNDPHRLHGLLRLGMLYELGGRPRRSMRLYGEVLKRAPRGGVDFEAARKRLHALSKDGSLLAGR